MSKECTCGSGNPRWELKDGAGIFCCFVCEACVEEKTAKYNPAIFTSAIYAATGNEQDLDFDVWAEIRSYDDER